MLNMQIEIVLLTNKYDRANKQAKQIEKLLSNNNIEYAQDDYINLVSDVKCYNKPRLSYAQDDYINLVSDEK
jgi:hypothetical protein